MEHSVAALILEHQFVAVFEIETALSSGTHVGVSRFVVLQLGNHTVKRHTLPEHHLKVFCTALFSSVWSSKAPFTYKPTNPSDQQSRYTTVARPDPCNTPVSSPWLPLLAYAFQPPAQSLLSPTLPLKPEMVQPAGAVLSAAVCQSASLPHTARQSNAQHDDVRVNMILPLHDEAQKVIPTPST